MIDLSGQAKTCLDFLDKFWFVLKSNYVILLHFTFDQSITLKGILEIGFSENSTMLPFTMPLHFSQSKTIGLFRYAKIYSILSFVLGFLNIAVTSCVGKTPSSTKAKRK
jgi:hypothetical protein